MGTSLTLAAHPQLSLRGSPLYSLLLDGRIFVIDMSTGLVSVDESTVVQWAFARYFSTRYQTCLACQEAFGSYLEVSGEEGKLAKRWCVTV